MMEKMWCLISLPLMKSNDLVRVSVSVTPILVWQLSIVSDFLFILAPNNHGQRVTRYLSHFFSHQANMPASSVVFEVDAFACYEALVLSRSNMIQDVLICKCGRGVRYRTVPFVLSIVRSLIFGFSVIKEE